MVKLAKAAQDNGIPALAHLTCVKSDENKILSILEELKKIKLKIYWLCEVIWLEESWMVSFCMPAV